MIVVPKIFKKVAMTTVLSTCLVGTFVTPSFAAINASSLDNKTGNELVSNFYVTDADVEDTVVISWDETALKLNVKDFDLKTDVQKSIDYYVSPGESNDDDFTVSILLKMPQASADALNTLEDSDDEVIESSFTDAGYVYYVLKEGLTLEPSAAAQFNTFDIAFKTVTDAGTPFTASLIAIKEPNMLPAPDFSVVENMLTDGRYEIAVEATDATADWYTNRVTPTYSLDGGVTYVDIPSGDYLLGGNGVFYFYIDEMELDMVGNLVHYKLQAEGYEDAIVPFSAFKPIF